MRTITTAIKQQNTQIMQDFMVKANFNFKHVASFALSGIVESTVVSI